MGFTAEAVAAAVRGRISGVQDHPFMVDLRGEAVRVARDEAIDPLAPKGQRMLELGRSGLAQVVTKLQASCSRVLGPVPLFMGVGELRFGWGEPDAAKFDRELSLEPCFAMQGWRPAIACSGHASIFELMKRATLGLSSGEFGLCVVGGIDSYADADSLLWIDSNGRLAAEGVRAGFTPGEGAAFFALATEAAVSDWGLTSLAILRGLGCAIEERGRRHPQPCLGRGLSRAVGEACASLGATELVDDIFCDINGERYRTEEWGFALLRNQARLRVTDYVTAVGECGDVGAASGTLGLTLALQAWQRGYARGQFSLVWASSDAGLRGAAVLQQSG